MLCVTEVLGEFLFRCYCVFYYQKLSQDLVFELEAIEKTLGYQQATFPVSNYRTKT